MATLKACSSCEQVTDNFSPDSRHKDGLQSQCRNCKNARLRETYPANREKRIANTLRWQRENPDKFRAKSRAWCKANLGKYNAKWARRYAAQLQRTPGWLTREQIKEMQATYLLCRELQWLSDPTDPLTVDHIVPLQGKNVSGLHVPWNLQIMPGSHNYRKSNKYGS